MRNQVRQYGNAFSCTLSLALCLPLVLAASAAQAGAKVTVDDDKYFELGLLLQPRLDVVEDAAFNADSTSIDPYLRRVRVMFYGQYTKYVNFFIETDTPKLGLKGDWTPRVAIQDAYMEFVVRDWLQIDAGMLLLPFSHHGMQGATSLLMLDYHADLIRYPDGSNYVWRDMGVMARGLLLDKQLEYRVAVTNGRNTEDRADPTQTEIRNRFDYPLLTGRLTFNFFEAEGGAGVGGFFYDGLYLKREPERLISPKKVLSVGGSAMYQQRAVLNSLNRAEGDYTPAEPGVSDFYAFNADLFVDWPIGDGTQAVNGQVNYYYYDLGRNSATTANGLLAELGYRVDCFQPVLGLDWVDYVNTQEGDLLTLKGGVTWWMLGHNANLKFELGASQKKDDDAASADPWVLYGAAQAQLVF